MQSRQQSEWLIVPGMYIGTSYEAFRIVVESLEFQIKSGQKILVI